MKDGRELNSNDCFEKDMESDLYTMASQILMPYSKGIFGVAVKKIEGGQMGMRVHYYGPNSYGISFYSAYIKFIYDGLYLVLSDNSVFPEIGKSSHTMKIPSIDYNPPKTYFDFKLDLEDSGKAKFDRERQKLHAFFYKITTMFLVIHECQHILNGHCGFFKESNLTSGEDAISKDY